MKAGCFKFTKGLVGAIHKYFFFWFSLYFIKNYDEKVRDLTTSFP